MADNKQKISQSDVSVEATLTRLLDAEERADSIIKEAGAARDQAIDDAVAQARATETRFESTLNELRAPYLQEAQSRADQEIAELGRKYQERQRELRKLCDKHGDEALDAAEAVILDPAR